MWHAIGDGQTEHLPALAAGRERERQGENKQLRF